MRICCFRYILDPNGFTKPIQKTSNRLAWLRHSPRHATKLNATARNFSIARHARCLDRNYTRHNLLLQQIFENVCLKWEHSGSEHVRIAGETMRKVLTSLSEIGGVSKSIAATTTNLDANLKTRPPCRHTKADSSIVAALDMVWDDLPWKRSKHLCKNFTDVMAAKDMKTAMLIGDTKTCGALLHSDDIYFGLLHIGPGTHYPAHSHDALELYDVLTTGADWFCDGKWKRGVAAGSFRSRAPAHRTITVTIAHIDAHHRHDMHFQIPPFQSIARDHNPRAAAARAVLVVGKCLG